MTFFKPNNKIQDMSNGSAKLLKVSKKKNITLKKHLKQEYIELLVEKSG